MALSGKWASYFPKGPRPPNLQARGPSPRLAETRLLTAREVSPDYRVTWKGCAPLFKSISSAFQVATSARYRPAMGSKAPPVPTLAELHRQPPRWFWAFCNNRGCSHHRPLPYAPFVIRWGGSVSSDALRRNLKCTACGHRGASIQLPSWADMQVEWRPFPVEAGRG